MSANNPKSISEEQLIKQLISKDKEAFNYLYDHYCAALYGVIFRIIGEEKIAEEVLQDAFLKVWNKIESYDASKGRLFTWMLNLSRNLAIDKLRSKEIKKEGKTDFISENVYVIDRNKFSMQSTESIGVEELLNYLNKDQQLILNLLYFKGYTQVEVSEEYNIPLGTVKTRLRAALIHLRKVLKTN